MLPRSGLTFCWIFRHKVQAMPVRVLFGLAGAIANVLVVGRGPLELDLLDRVAEDDEDEAPLPSCKVGEEEGTGPEELATNG
jgi:hypothetical protein